MDIYDAFGLTMELVSAAVRSRYGPLLAAVAATATRTLATNPHQSGVAVKIIKTGNFGLSVSPVILTIRVFDHWLITAWRRRTAPSAAGAAVGEAATAAAAAAAGVRSPIALVHVRALVPCFIINNKRPLRTRSGLAPHFLRTAGAPHSLRTA
jgi:hypothetical protein